MDRPRSRALLLGVQVGGLTGVVDDVTRMGASLTRRGFVVTACLGAEATREGILKAYRQLIDRTREGDVAVVYFSGHGGRFADEAGVVQYVVTDDFEASTDGDFRGVTADELSALAGELTKRTRNVTVIFDCCHASQMTRGAARPRPRPMYIRSLPPVGNPDVVRVFAAGATQQAYERTIAGRRGGVLTDALVRALERVGGETVTWEVLAAAAAPRLLRYGQQLEIAGPYTRTLFSLEERPACGAVPILVQHGRVVVVAGRLLGGRVGDVYDVAEVTGEPVIEGRVKAVGWCSSELALAVTTRSPLPDYVVAMPRTRRPPAELIAELRELQSHAPGGVELAAAGPGEIGIDNHGGHQVHVHVLAVAGERISLLSSAAPLGVALMPAEHHTASVGDAEEIVMIAASQRVDLRALATEPLVGRVVAPPPLAAGEVFRHVRTGDRAEVVVRCLALPLHDDGGARRA